MLLAISLWSLAVGLWLLVFGCWSLAFGVQGSAFRVQRFGFEVLKLFKIVQGCSKVVPLRFRSMKFSRVIGY